MKYPLNDSLPYGLTIQTSLAKKRIKEATSRAVLFDALKLDKRVAYVQLTACQIEGLQGFEFSMDFSFSSESLVYFSSTKAILEGYEVLLKNTKECTPDIVIIEVAEQFENQQQKRNSIKTTKGIFLSCAKSVALHECLAVLDRVDIEISSISGIALEKVFAGEKKMTNDLIFQLNELVAQKSLNHYLATEVAVPIA